MKEIPAEKVEALASQGLTMEQIADCVGVARSTLYERMKADPDVSDAIKRGRSKGIATIANALFTAAKQGNITAQIFYLKNRAPQEWQDRKDLNVDGEIRNTVINAQPAQTTDEWQSKHGSSGNHNQAHKLHS